MGKGLLVFFFFLIFIPLQVFAQASSLQSATANAVLPSGHWVWPLTPALTDELHAMMDTVIDDARSRFGTGVAKVVILENSTSLMGDFSAKAQAEFPGAVVVGVGPGNENYNAFTTEVFAEHGQRSIALTVLGGLDITRVQASGQKNVGQGSIAQMQIDAGEQIAIDLKPHLVQNQSNLILLFGPGHNPNHKLVLCGLKQGVAGLSNLCNPANPNDPELASLPELPLYIRVLSSSGYYTANTVVGSSVISQSVVGLLIQGHFRLALSGLSGSPNITNIIAPIQQIIQELGGVPTHLFLVPGHPAVGGYEALRQKMVTLLPGTTIFGHEGGGEIGHDQTTGPVAAVINHLYIAGLRASGTAAPLVGDANNDNVVNNFDFLIWKQQYLQNTGSANFNNDTIISGKDYILWSNNYL